VFLQFLDEFLVPVLKPGQIGILDNAKAHTVEGVREWIEGAGARVVEALYEAIAQALQTLPPTDAKGFFKHVGFCI
jgi:hypothetical protein